MFDGPKPREQGTASKQTQFFQSFLQLFIGIYVSIIKFVPFLFGNAHGCIKMLLLNTGLFPNLILNCKKLNFSASDFGWVSLLLSLQIQHIEKALKTLQMIVKKNAVFYMENICACMLTDKVRY